MKTNNAIHKSERRLVRVITIILFIMFLLALLAGTSGCAMLSDGMGRQNPPLHHWTRVMNYESIGHEGYFPTYRLVPKR